MLFQMLSLVLDVVTGLIAGTCLLRFLMQWQRITFHQPLGQFVFAVTDWLVMPLRKIVPPWSAWDASCLVAAWLVKMVQFTLLWLLAGGATGADGASSALWLPLITLLGLAQLTVSALSALVLVMAVLSWVNPGSVMHAMVSRLSAPFLRPFQRWVPMLGGVDLSPLALLLALQLVGILLADWRMSWMP